MSDAIVPLLPAALGGAGVAALYLIVLWACVRAITRARHPGAWVAAGAAGRIALVCAGVFVVSAGDGPGMFAALLGFVAVRSLALAVARRPRPDDASLSARSAGSRR